MVNAVIKLQSRVEKQAFQGCKKYSNVSTTGSRVAIPRRKAGISRMKVKKILMASRKGCNPAQKSRHFKFKSSSYLRRIERRRSLQSRVEKQAFQGLCKSFNQISIHSISIGCNPAQKSRHFKRSELAIGVQWLQVLYFLNISKK